jgi:acetyl esterase/lipase
MPLDDFVASRLHLIPDLSVAEQVANPALREQVLQGSLDDRSYKAPAVSTSEEYIDGPIGPFRVRIYRPDTESVRPALVWSHGGGFIGGSVDMHEGDLVCREICGRARAPVVSVDYHVANGSTVTYPSLHREHLAGFQWTRDNAGALGVDPEHITIGGASSGASLTMSASLEMTRTGIRQPARLILAYPAAHPRLPEDQELLAKTATLPAGARFSQTDLDLFFGQYRGDRADVRYADAELNDLGGLPPSLVILNEYDDLTASGREPRRKA